MEAPKSLILLFFLLFAFYFLSTSIADDGAAMLALAKSFSHPPTDWSATTSSNNYCRWTDISCISGRVSIVNLEKHGLVGFVSPTIANLTSLKSIYLNDNKLTGIIPKELTFMTSLRFIDVSNNNLTGKIPKFPASVKFIYKPGNSLMGTIAGDSSTKHGTGGSWSVLMACVITFAITIFLVFLGWVARKVVLKMRNRASDAVSDVGGSSNGHGADNVNACTDENRRDPLVLDGGIVSYSVEALREATNGFSEDNILGSGGFGVVYSGKLQDETKVAVKKMNLSSMDGERRKQFDAEVAVLAKVRHRHVIDLLGYSVNGDERLLVYEHMSQGNLGHHLFDPAKHGYFPLTWKQRVRIALDVAQGVEYFHRFALESSIHRDIKSSNILLGDDMTAKVSDFGLVKVVAADGNHSAVQKTEGTFGYIAPEYAIDGVLTTKVDVYAFGVVLMEMITGKEALKEISGEETFQLVPWFRSILVKGKIRTALDLTLDCDYDEVIIRIIQQVAKLASYCTSRKPKRRPDMGHAVNVLKQLVEKWKSPCEEEGEEEESLGKDMDMNLVQCLQKWQDEGASSSAMFSEPLPDEKQTIFREPLLNPRAKKDKYSEEEEEERMMRLLTITPKDDPEQLRRMIRYKIRNRSKLINDI